jgi:hypothetical protein
MLGLSLKGHNTVPRPTLDAVTSAATGKEREVASHGLPTVARGGGGMGRTALAEI